MYLNSFVWGIIYQTQRCIQVGVHNGLTQNRLDTLLLKYIQTSYYNKCIHIRYQKNVQQNGTTFIWNIAFSAINHRSENITDNFWSYLFFLSFVDGSSNFCHVESLRRQSSIFLVLHSFIPFLLTRSKFKLLLVVV